MAIAGEGKIGLLERKRRNSTGTISAIIRLKQGLFKLICEEHGHSATRSNGYGYAMYAGSHPEQFCPDCRKAVGLPERVDPWSVHHANPNMGMCDGCGEVVAGIVTLKHLRTSHTIKLCPDCHKPGAPARKRWEKRIARAAEEHRASYKGMSKSARARMIKELIKEQAALNRVAVMEEEEE